MSKRSPGSSSRSRRETKPITPEKIKQETEPIKQKETEYIKIPQDPYTDRVVGVFVASQRKVPQNQLMHGRGRRRKPDNRIWVGLPIQ